jgi:hypothetical protein
MNDPYTNQMGVESSGGHGIMKFKPRKSRCIIIKKGGVSNQFKLRVQDEEVPLMIANPIKCLGKCFNTSLSDIN